MFYLMKLITALFSLWMVRRRLHIDKIHKNKIHSYINKVPSASVAQLDAPSDWRPGGRGLNPRRGRQHSFVEIDHEIFSTVILSLPLIQEGQFLAKECAQYWLIA